MNRRLDASLIIPVFATEPTLRRCLESAVTQDHPSLEILVVNDGSPGNPRPIFDDFRRRDPRLRYTEHSTNLGIYEARRTGFTLSRGRYLLQLDSDDELVDPAAVRTLVTEMDRTGVDLLQFGVEQVVPDGARRWQVLDKSPGSLLGHDEIWKYFANSTGWNPTLWSRIVRREVFASAYAALGPRTLVHSEDRVVFCLLAWFARSYGTLDRPLYRYYLGIGQPAFATGTELSQWASSATTAHRLLSIAASLRRSLPEPARYLTQRAYWLFDRLVRAWGTRVPPTDKLAVWRAMAGAGDPGELVDAGFRQDPRHFAAKASRVLRVRSAATVPVKVRYTSLVQVQRAALVNWSQQSSVRLVGYLRRFWTEEVWAAREVVGGGTPGLAQRALRRTMHFLRRWFPVAFPPSAL